MTEYAIIGTQWGDEGKGKIVDLLTEKENIKFVVRYNGGNNAGHTVIVGNEEYKFHLLPSGVLHSNITNVIGNGVLIDPEVLVKELYGIESRGFEVNLKISEVAHLIMPYHRVLDGIEGVQIGTTGRGIGPASEDAIGRRGIRVCDLLDEETFRKKLSGNLKRTNEILTKVYGREPLPFDKIFTDYLSFITKFEKYVCDTSRLLHDAQSRNESILFESAQGTMLDPFFGTYPYTTSTHPTIGGIDIGTGIRARIDKVIGVVKAYTTRVGGGPLPTELRDSIGERMQTKGKEVGTTTGRTRRCGWLDTLVPRYSVRTNGIDELTITKLDVLDEFPIIKLCVGYECSGKRIENISPSLDLGKCSPIYEEMDGWLSDISNVRNREGLPDNAKKYLFRIEELTEAAISIISVGPEREQTILNK